MSAERAIDPTCVCLAVADYIDKQYGVTIAAALEDWPFSKVLMPLTGKFLRAGGFQALLDGGVVSTPPSQSLIFFVDADMVAFPGLLRQVCDVVVHS